MYRRVRQNPRAWLGPRNGGTEMVRHYSTVDFVAATPLPPMGRRRASR